MGAVDTGGGGGGGGGGEFGLIGTWSEFNKTINSF